MLKGLGDLGNLMKLQKEMKNLQKQLKASTVEETSNDGNVTATVNGELSLLGISIKPEFAAQNDVKKLEKAIVSAVNNAAEKIKKQSAEAMKSAAGGLGIPGLG